jgi:peptidoglycan/xylan/chitin deacetylase (PgdA/CDA1 family)
MKGTVKAALMHGFLASRFPAVRNATDRWRGRSRLTVLAYHQVKEPADDCSTVSPAAFTEQMRHLKRHYDVVSLSDGVAAVTAGGPARRLVAITFDDGYRDNATIAAPILRSLGLPACFFVSTDMIGSAVPFPHDVAQRRPPQEHMSWDDVRQLAANGFEIGSHTCSHADMGTVTLVQSRDELRGSRERLEHELGRPVSLFAFPYGHRTNVRPDTLAEAAREYGVCCLAEGGHNLAPADARTIRRIVVSTGVTFLAFQAILEGFPMLRLNNPYRADWAVDGGLAPAVEQHSGHSAGAEVAR